MARKSSSRGGRGHAKRAAGRGNGQVRIIAGRWRGRKLPVADLPGLRPTPDRSRETLFNWLVGRLAGARCLDLFAGSGALGFEALSRGAESVCMVETQAMLVRQLRTNAELLEADGAEIVATEAQRFLTGTARPFDIVFLDPPFRQGLLTSSCAALAQGGWLSPRALVYLEAEQEAGEPDLPAGWAVIRRGRAGQVACYLVEA